MRPILPPHGTGTRSYGGRLLPRVWFRRPTLHGTAKAGVIVALAIVSTVVLVIPAVFAVTPIAPEAEAITLCLPGIGPIQRFTDDLQGEREERAYIHESVHAQQCRSFGATWFNQRISRPEGRLTLEAQALCAEAAMLTIRGADRARVSEQVVEALASEYFSESDLRRGAIIAEVDGACRAMMGD
ncbi:MAG: hypothetical protein HKN72_11105 [Gemmatimonadetes bacterium]|nr:hypothetical protein [Gemmatimonadota bacterium]